MSGKTKGIIIGIILFIIVIGTSAATQYLNRIPENPIGTVGNTAGNLYNKGLFCEKDDMIYFSNAYDNGFLYSMNSDETEFKKISNMGVNYINIGGKQLYYYQTTLSGMQGLGYLRNTTGIYRTDTSGKNTTGLGRDATGPLILCDNQIFYTYYSKKEGPNLHSVSLDGKTDTRVSSIEISPLCIYNGRFYYTGSQKDFSLFCYDPLAGTNTLVFEGKIWFPQIVNDYVYYMDAAQNYKLCRFSLTETEPVAYILTNDRVDTFNVYGNYIYYQKNDETSPALMRMDIDGSSPEVVVEGNYSDINITSRYVYFHSFNQDMPIYRTPTFGDISVSTFDGANQAALENIIE